MDNFCSITAAFVGVGTLRLSLISSGEQHPIGVVATVVANQTADALFDSCKDVQTPSVNGKVLALMCGVEKASQCSPQKWLTFMASKAPGFKIEVKMTTFQIELHAQKNY